MKKKAILLLIILLMPLEAQANRFSKDIRQYPDTEANFENLESFEDSRDIQCPHGKSSDLKHVSEKDNLSCQKDSSDFFKACRQNR